MSFFVFKLKLDLKSKVKKKKFINLKKYVENDFRVKTLLIALEKYQNLFMGNFGWFKRIFYDFELYLIFLFIFWLIKL